MKIAIIILLLMTTILPQASAMNITYDSSATDMINLSWQNNIEFEYFNIERTIESSEKTLIYYNHSTSEDTVEFIDSGAYGGLTKDTDYTYHISAYSSSGSNTDSASIYMTYNGANMIDNTPPQEPQLKKIKSTDGGSVYLEWDCIFGEKVSIYKIYRNGTFVGQTPLASFEDQTPEDNCYTYTISALDLVGNSINSTPLSINSDSGVPNTEINDFKKNFSYAEPSTIIKITSDEDGQIILNFTQDQKEILANRTITSNEEDEYVFDSSQFKDGIIKLRITVLDQSSNRNMTNYELLVDRKGPIVYSHNFDGISTMTANITDNYLIPKDLKLHYTTDCGQSWTTENITSAGNGNYTITGIDSEKRTCDIITYYFTGKDSLNNDLAFGYPGSGPSSPINYYYNNISMNISAVSVTARLTSFSPTNGLGAYPNNDWDDGWTLEFEVIIRGGAEKSLFRFDRWLSDSEDIYIQPSGNMKMSYSDTDGSFPETDIDSSEFPDSPPEGLTGLRDEDDIDDTITSTVNIQVKIPLYSSYGKYSTNYQVACYQ